MSITHAMLEEIELLNIFNLDTTQQGIKIHQEATPAKIEAGKRLFDKGLITLTDGGYLTPLGQQAVEHVKVLISLLGG